MARKNFSKGIDALLGDSVNLSDVKEEAKPVKATLEKKTVSKKEKEKNLESRATFLVDVDHLEKLRACAHWDRVPIKIALKKALSQYFDTYSEKELNKAVESYREHQGELN